MAFSSVKFEVHGKVQKVFFRKHTEQEAKKLHLVGWVANSARGTVMGEMQGTASDLRAMKKWLQEIGSPKSVIEKVVFTDEHSLDTLAYTEFSRRENVP